MIFIGLLIRLIYISLGIYEFKIYLIIHKDRYFLTSDIYWVLFILANLGPARNTTASKVRNSRRRWTRICILSRKDFLICRTARWDDTMSGTNTIPTNLSSQILRRATARIHWKRVLWVWNVLFLIDINLAGKSFFWLISFIFNKLAIIMFKGLVTHNCNGRVVNIICYFDYQQLYLQLVFFGSRVKPQQLLQSNRVEQYCRGVFQHHGADDKWRKFLERYFSSVTR